MSQIMLIEKSLTQKSTYDMSVEDSQNLPTVVETGWWFSLLRNKDWEKA